MNGKAPPLLEGGRAAPAVPAAAPPPQPPDVGTDMGLLDTIPRPLTDLRALPPTEIRLRLVALTGVLDYENAPPKAREWWDGLDAHYGDRPAAIFHVLEELHRLGANLDELHSAHVEINAPYDEIGDEILYLRYVKTARRHPILLRAMSEATRRRERRREKDDKGT